MPSRSSLSTAPTTGGTTPAVTDYGYLNCPNTILVKIAVIDGPVWVGFGRSQTGRAEDSQFDDDEYTLEGFTIQPRLCDRIRWRSVDPADAGEIAIVAYQPDDLPGGAEFPLGVGAFTPAPAPPQTGILEFWNGGIQWGANLRFARGFDTLTFPGGSPNSNELTITHGLGQLPIGIWLTEDYAAAAPNTPRILLGTRDTGKTSTQFIVKGRNADSTNLSGTKNFWWCAVGL